MSNPWGEAPSSYLQDTGSLASIHAKIQTIHQSRQASLPVPPTEAINSPHNYELPSQTFKARILEILTIVKEYNQLKRTFEQKQTWNKFSDFVNEGPISNLISIIDQMSLYYEKFVEHRKDIIELLNRESIDLQSSILLPFRLHQDFITMLKSFVMESKHGCESKFKKIQKLNELNPGVKTDLFCIIQNMEDLRERVRVYAEMVIARDQKFNQILL